MPAIDVPSHLALQRVDAAQAAHALAQDIARRLQDALAARGQAVLSVSGGKSPIPLFEALRRHDLDWSRVDVTLVDERCVPCTHEASNARLVRAHLLQERAAVARFTPMVTQEQAPLPAPFTLAKTAGLALRAIGCADVVLLGMGTDGHTASLFPDAPNLAEALDPACPHACLAIELATPPANAPFARVTQTLAQLLSARHLVLPIAGDDKCATLRNALAARSDRLPISHLLHQHTAPLALWITP